MFHDWRKPEHPDETTDLREYSSSRDSIIIIPSASKTYKGPSLSYYNKSVYIIIIIFCEDACILKSGCAQDNHFLKRFFAALIDRIRGLCTFMFERKIRYVALATFVIMHPHSRGIRFVFDLASQFFLSFPFFPFLSFLSRPFRTLCWITRSPLKLELPICKLIKIC